MREKERLGRSFNQKWNTTPADTRGWFCDAPCRCVCTLSIWRTRTATNGATFQSRPPPIALAHEVLEPRSLNPPRKNGSCDSLANPNNACAKGENLVGSEICGPRRYVCSRV